MTDGPFSEEAIVRYLLGDLPEEEQVEIEDRAFQDRHCLERILAAESDLIDEYVRGELSDSRRLLFDSRFLASAERRKKVQFARALAGVLADSPASANASSPIAHRPQPLLWEPLVGFFRALRPALRLSLAGAAVLIVIGASLAIVETIRLRGQLARFQAEQQSRQRDQQILEDRLSGERARSEDLSNRLQSEQQQRQRSEELIRELEHQQREIAVQPAQPTVLSLALLPGVPRSGSAQPKLVMLQSTRLVRLQIGIDPGDEYASFRVELHTRAEQTIWTRDNLSLRTRHGARSVTLNLPASRLGAGQYEVALKGVPRGGEPVDLGYYYFEVVKK